MTEEELEKLADEIWEQINSAHHWGDGFQSAYNRLLRGLKQAAELGEK